MHLSSPFSNAVLMVFIWLLCKRLELASKFPPKLGSLLGWKYDGPRMQGRPPRCRLV